MEALLRERGRRIRLRRRPRRGERTGQRRDEPHAGSQAAGARLACYLAPFTRSLRGAHGRQEEALRPGRVCDRARAGEARAAAVAVETEWQSFRVRKSKDADSELNFTAEFEYDEPGSYLLAARVADVFGNDGIATVQVKVK